jgi:glycosyltransferase involved in cell wall biosynthesis
MLAASAMSLPLESRPKIAIMFAMLGPYHVARINSVAADYSVVGIEGSHTSDVYAWEKFVGADEFQRVTLFTDGPIAHKSHSEIWQKVSTSLTELAPEVVVVPGWASSSSLAMLAWSIVNQVPAIVLSESQAIDHARVWWREWLKRQTVRPFAAALVGGRRHVAYLEQLGMPRERIFTGYDVVDNAHFAAGAEHARARAAELRQELGLPERFFLACARFVPEKNVSRLLEAFARYRNAAGSAAWDLVILGDGAMRGALERQIAARSLSSYIHMPGFKQYDTLPTYYGLASAFVHASTTEPWGLVVNEAMAAGLPVIVSERCGCAPDLVESGNGVLFDPSDVDALAQAMGHIAAPGCDRTAMGRRSQEIIDRWRPEAFAQGLRQAVETALAQPGARVGVLGRAMIGALRRI